MSNVSAVPPISDFVSRFFLRVVKRYFRRHFRSVMVANLEAIDKTTTPLVVYGNHVSWWDPMLITLLSRVFMPQRKHYAPMDAVQLKRYPILRKIGIFPVDTTSGRAGAAEFIRTVEAILKSGGVLWITPQARFADVREFPLRFKAGLAMLVSRIPNLQLLPLAVEYTFWDERMPEALGRFGEVFTLPDAGTEIGAINQVLEDKLSAVMLALQADSLKRDASLFTPVLTGKRGTGGVYGFIQRTRKNFAPDHTPRPSA